MGMNIANCPRCGKIFVKGIRDVCPNCIKDIDKMYEKCAQYLRENRGSSIHEVSEATEVPVPQITKFIREGRISLMGNPNLGYPCEMCGTMIRESNICENCRGKLKKDLNNALEDQKRADEQKKQDHRVAFQIRDRLEKDRQ